MNASILKTFTPGDLHDNDLQDLRDFALHAPYEWRNAFTKLLDAASEYGREQELSESIVDLAAQLTRAKERATEVFLRMETVLAKMPAGETKNEMEKLSDLIDDLTKELEPEKDKAPKSPSAPGGSPPKSGDPGAPSSG